MPLVNKFIEAVKQQNLFSPKDKLIIALSGGVDSVVLCELCKQAGYDFIIAHCNFQLRGEESIRDERFVQSLADRYEVELFLKKFDTEEYAGEEKISIQEAARKLRYEWFNELIETDISLKYVVTAHHSDDNIETMLMNFFRGTGLHGLTGIPAIISDIRRPLLGFSKNELLQFAKDNKLEYVEDSSNQSSKYTRNYFRNELIPAISKVYPQVNDNLQDNINRFKEIECLYQFSVGAIKKKLCRQKGDEIHIPVKQLMAFNNRALIYEIINQYGFTEKQVDEVVKLATSESGKYIASTGSHYRIIKHRHWFIISPSPAQLHDVSTIVIEETDSPISFAGGEIKFEIKTTANPTVLTSGTVACLDAADISFPLLLRKWKTGDYFYPLGMKKKKKITRFLIDQKLSKTEKENIWLIEMNKKIIWVVGQRIDDRFKLIPSSKKSLQISWHAPVSR